MTIAGMMPTICCLYMSNQGNKYFGDHSFCMWPILLHICHPNHHLATTSMHHGTEIVTCIWHCNFSSLASSSHLKINFLAWMRM